MESNIVEYMLHDPIGNVEGTLTDFSEEFLAKVADSPLVIVAVDEDGRRSVVDPSDVTEPVPAFNGVMLAGTVYVDDRMKAVIDVFDALVGAGDVAAIDTADTEAKRQTVAEALAALKALVYGKEE